MSRAATCRDRLQARMRSIWETERTGKACVRASSALGSRGENIRPPNLQDGCPSPGNNPTASAHAFLERFPFSTTAAAIWRLIETMVTRRTRTTGLSRDRQALYQLNYAPQKLTQNTFPLL